MSCLLSIASLGTSSLLLLDRSNWPRNIKSIHFSNELYHFTSIEPKDPFMHGDPRCGLRVSCLALHTASCPSLHMSVQVQQMYIHRTFTLNQVTTSNDWHLYLKVVQQSHSNDFDFERVLTCKSPVTNTIYSRGTIGAWTSFLEAHKAHPDLAIGLGIGQTHILMASWDRFSLFPPFVSLEEFAPVVASKDPNYESPADQTL